MRGDFTDPSPACLILFKTNLSCSFFHLEKKPLFSVPGGSREGTARLPLLPYGSTREKAGRTGRRTTQLPQRSALDKVRAYAADTHWRSDILGAGHG